jgi:DHA2 family lincomycin resistance protein-like MFS transporter
VLPPHLYSHGSSLLGTSQQVAGAMGTALVVMIMSSRAVSQARDGVGPVAAQLNGMRWAFAVSAILCVAVLGLVALLPARLPGATPEPEPDLMDELGEDEQLVACPTA